MNISHRISLRLLLCAALGQWVSSAAADDLLPPPVRQVDKRMLGGSDDRIRRSYYEMGGAASAAFSPDGKMLATSGENRGIVLLDVAGGRLISGLEGLSSMYGVTVAFTPKGNQLITAGSSPNRDSFAVNVWDAARRTLVRNLDEGANDTPFTALAVSPDGNTVALAGGYGRRSQTLAVHFWDMASGDEIGRIDGLVNAAPQRQGAEMFQALAYSPDGRSLAVLLPGRVVLVELATRKVRGQMNFMTTPETRTGRAGASPGSIAYSPDGRTLAVGCTDGAVRRFDVPAARELPPLSGHSTPVVAVTFTQDGKSILSYALDGQFSAWRADAGQQWKPKTGQLSDSALEELWDALGRGDPLDIFGSVEALAASPAQATALLRKRLPAVPRADSERVDRLVDDLQKGDYNARRRAVVALRKIGAAAAPALRRSQERGGYDELIRRLQFEFENLAPPAEQVRAVRALAVLERIGDAEAQKLLKQLAEGSGEAALTQQARAALDRLAKPETPKTEPAPEALWDALAVEDSAASYRAVRALAGKPSTSTMLRDKLKDLAGKDTFNDDPARVSKLIEDLENKTFAVRDRATKALRNLGPIAVPALKKAQEAKSDLELKRRVTELLDEAAKGSPAPEILRVTRAIETLELMGGTEARQALAALKDVEIKWVREAAGEALRRLR